MYFPVRCEGHTLELQTNVREYLTITETIGQAGLRIYANIPAVPYDICVWVPFSCLLNLPCLSSLTMCFQSGEGFLHDCTTLLMVRLKLYWSLGTAA